MNLRFERIDDLKKNGDEDSMWQYDQIKAYIGDVYVGHIRIAYVSEKQIKAFKKEPFLFGKRRSLKHMESSYEKNYRSGGDGEQRLHTIYTPNYLEQAKTILMLFGKKNKDMTFEEQFSQIHSFSEEQLQSYVQSYRKQLWNHMKKQAKGFMEYHFCRPDIDFIRVEDDHLRQGIGTALYQEASKWMNEKGLVLHSSTLQQPEAKAAWDKLMTQGKAHIFQRKGEKHPRFRYIENVEPTWLTDKTIERSEKIKPEKSIKKTITQKNRMGKTPSY